MDYKQSLHHRITISFLLFGLLLSLAITAGVNFAFEDIEKELVEDSLNSELNFFLNYTDKSPGVIHQVGSKITLYYVDDTQKEIVPDIFRDLPNGYRDMQYGQHRYHVLVAKNTDKSGAIYIVEDATSFERREEAMHIALFASVIIAILVAWWLGSWLSGKIISPVSALARQVAELKPDNRTVSCITNNYANDEVGQLAATFDRYLDQIAQFIDREQEFTANASHELRTPLTVINSAAELLLDNPALPERERHQIERIARAGNRMTQMLEVLLLLARDAQSEMDSGERCSLKEVSLETCEQYRFLIQNKAIVLNCRIIHDFEIEASKAVISIVLGNLVRNAINYTDEGRVVVTVDNGRVTVSDSGHGIPHEKIEQIFLRHYRGPGSDGSGIGLSIVKRICDRQKWKITIESEVTLGTTVHIDFTEHTAS